MSLWEYGDSSLHSDKFLFNIFLRWCPLFFRFYEDAAIVAFEQKDESALLFVQRKCPLKETLVQSKIANLVQQLQTRK